MGFIIWLIVLILSVYKWKLLVKVGSKILQFISEVVNL